MNKVFNMKNTEKIVSNLRSQVVALQSELAAIKARPHLGEGIVISKPTDTISEGYYFVKFANGETDTLYAADEDDFGDCTWNQFTKLGVNCSHWTSLITGIQLHSCIYTDYFPFTLYPILEAE